ncbi:hypothetical protein NDU88_002598 [Pleurodeles waltl]|uniref:Uncharacterized protein n=1 Tax=Pleurodeles waltl TaxID=8319 RepID=A0AAV7TN28_PLEWA|nr:hypothetical protein NDU88_002598 [Pleurodeles waltl]
MTPDFQVPGAVKLDNGLQDKEEENIENAMEEDETEDAKEGEETTDARAARPEGRAGSSDIPTETTDPVQKESTEETHKYRHVPGEAWLNKGSIASQEGNLGGTRETLRGRNTATHQYDIVPNS